MSNITWLTEFKSKISENIQNVSKEEKKEFWKKVGQLNLSIFTHQST